MNKSKLIELINAATAVTGDVSFQDAGVSLRELANDGELNRQVICALVIEVNALSEILFDSYCLPFLVVKKNEDNYLLLSDFDGEVNFGKKSNAIALMLTVRAIENVFGKKIGSAPVVINESDFNEAFSSFASEFKNGDVVSAIMRANQITAALVEDQVNEMAASLANAIADEMPINIYDENDNDVGVDRGIATEIATEPDLAPAVASDDVDPFKNAL